MIKSYAYWKSLDRRPDPNHDKEIYQKINTYQELEYNHSHQENQNKTKKVASIHKITIDKLEKMEEKLQPPKRRLFYVNKKPSKSPGKEKETSSSLSRLQSGLAQSMRGFNTRQGLKKMPINIFDLVRMCKRRQSLGLNK